MIVEEKILGMTLKQWVESMDTKGSEIVEKALNYYDGNQEEEMVELLSDSQKGRKNWKADGIIPRWRNLTNMIVEKSSKLFKDKEPQIQLFADDSITEDLNATERLMTELNKSEWLDYFNNEDSTRRLVKTIYTLVQWDVIDKSLVFEQLTKANSFIVTDNTLKNVLACIYKVSDDGPVETYRLITPEEYIDIIEIEDVQASSTRVEIAKRIPNPYGIVPIAPIHDTKNPRCGLWNLPGSDLVNINELYNLHMTDSEYVISWMKLPTLIQIDLDVAEDSQIMMDVLNYGEVMPRSTPVNAGLKGGPGQAIKLNTTSGIGKPEIKYISPVVDIKPIDEVVTSWVEQIANDWSVRMQFNGRATSGFQVIVEELPNRELRQQRAKMFNNGFKKLFKIIRTVINTQYGNEVFSDNLEPFVTFEQPELPVDFKVNEEAWDLKIAGNRASRIDYLMIEEGITRPEAELRVKQIALDNSSINSTVNSIV